jgi:hypothetical protein
MIQPAIYTSEPMATRALAAEIRHAPDKLVRLLAERIGVADLSGFSSVSCEASEKVDLELRFENVHCQVIGIEAKFDNELTRNQVDRQLAVVDQLVIMLTSTESAPAWIEEIERVSVITWEEALKCFSEPRLTVNDISSMPVLKSGAEILFRAQIFSDFADDWFVEVRRGGSGMPSIIIESPLLPSGRTLRGQIQVAGRGMPRHGAPVMVEYSIGVSVPATVDEYPDPMLPHAMPGWIEPLRALHREVLEGHERRFGVSTRKPGNGTSELGRRKVPLVEEYLAGKTWLAKGYTDGWALGIKSLKVPLDDIDALTSTTIEIFNRWYAVEVERLAFSG